MTDPHYSNGSDDRDLDPRFPNAKATMLPTCAVCRLVAYKFIRRADGRALCLPCFERISSAEVVNEKA